MSEIFENTLYYGDNLQILRQYVPDESVDLIYLAPPFNSNRSYDILFRDERGKHAEAQVIAFKDTWNWMPSTQQSAATSGLKARYNRRMDYLFSQWSMFRCAMQPFSAKNSPKPSRFCASRM